MTDTLQLPPRTKSHDGSARQVGVEIEFAALSAESAARLVQNSFGGELVTVDAHRFDITGTELGDFRSELDLQYVHRSPSAPPPGDDEASQMFAGVQYGLRELLGSVSALVVPCEIVCPPVPLNDLPKIDRLVQALSEAGARGTGENPLYAFGAQLNPEIAESESWYIVSVLKAYLLSSQWLRAQIAVDVTRRIFAFTDPFPVDYTLLVVDPDYWPETDQLIDDYLAYNPTRNRELDMLPLFAWLDEARIANAVPDPRIKKRPTFHYRLPDAQFGERNWSIIEEWNRWCAVERLAEDRGKLAEMARAFEENRSRLIADDWGVRAGEWITAS